MFSQSDNPHSPPNAQSAAQQDAQLTLAQLNDNQPALVTNITQANPELRRRLYALGLVPGAQITRLRTAPLGDPLQVRVGGSSLSIRASDATAVLVHV
jgi:ferrous iron transport protein A